MTDLIPQIRDSLIEAGISPRKILSQNFLVNSSILERQIEYADINENDSVLEIGGGTGVLTERLAKKAGKVFCIEFDRQLAPYLKRKFKNNTNVEIIQGDALKIDLPKTNKIVANLPYHISSPITFKLLDYGFELAVLMYQLEFAKRMIAEPSTDDYSRLSVNLQYQAEVEILEKISKKNFYPPPKVDSAIVKIIPLEKEFPVEVKYFRQVTRLLFNTKNKLVSSVFYDYFKRKIAKEERISFKKQIDDSITYSSKRVRELSINELVQITQEIVKTLTNLKKLPLLEN